jgi:hypothetical protein
MAKMLGVKSMGKDGKIVNEAGKANLNKAIDEEREKKVNNQGVQKLYNNWSVGGRTDMW